MIETYRGVTYPHQLDHMGHMNVQWYTAKFDEATWHLFSALGITTAYIRDKQKGMAAVEQTTRYLAEVKAGDLLLVESQLLEQNPRTLRFLHRMRNAETGHDVASSELVAVHMDLEARRACSFPEEIVQRCTQMLAQQGITETTQD